MIWLNHLDEISICILVVVVPVLVFAVSHFAFLTVMHWSAIDRWCGYLVPRLAVLCGVSPDARGDKDLEADIIPICR